MPEDDPAPLPPSGYLDCMTMHHLRQLHDAVQALMAADGMTMAIDYRLPMPRGDTVAILRLGPDLATPFSKPGAWSLTGAHPIGDFEEIATERRPGGMPPSRPSVPTTEPLDDPAPDPEQAADPMAAGEAQDSGGGGGMAAPAPVAAPVDELLGGERGGLQRQCLAEHDPVQAVAGSGVAPEPATAEARPEPPAPGTARALAARAQAAVWTEDEDTRLIALVVTGIHRLGLAKDAAIRAAAVELGRPEAGTSYRCYHKLKDRLTAALADAARSNAAAPAEAATPDPALPPAASGADDRSPLQRHLDDLPRSSIWGPGLDADLVRLAITGMGIEDIAVEMALRAADVRTRFNLLTGYHKIDEGERSTWCRRFSREDLLAELEARLAEG